MIRESPNLICIIASRAVISPAGHLIRLVLKQSFWRPEHTVKSISKRINNLRNEDIKFAERPPLACKSSWRKEVSATATPSLSASTFRSVCEGKRYGRVDYDISRSERERVGSCVRLSESVPALAIKSGRGSGGGARAKMLFTAGGWGFVWRGRFQSDYSQFGTGGEWQSVSVAQCRGRVCSRVFLNG